jgi:surfeit locus 1 family protein
MTADPALAESGAKIRTRARSKAALLSVGIAGSFLFALFIALGVWQIQRLFWKRELIERVDQRAHAKAVAAPERQRWPQITAESDEYRHVQLRGQFLYQETTKVLASTTLGRGFWVMTPLRTADDSIIYINRGFIPSSTSGTAAPQVAEGDVSGLLRMSEPGGAFLHHNNPSGQQWYSRDVQAMALAHHLNNVAPFFIDAETTTQAANPGTPGDGPVAGLTVIAFDNNHLVYTLTWFALALMVAGGTIYTIRSELKLSRGTSDNRADSLR